MDVECPYPFDCVACSFVEFFHCPVKGKKRTVAYYMWDRLYWVAAITIWVISHFPLIKHFSSNYALCIISCVTHSWHFRCCPGTGIFRLLIKLQLSMLKFCYPSFHSSISSYGFSMILVVVRYAGFLDFSLLTSYCTGLL